MFRHDWFEIDEWLKKLKLPDPTSHWSSLQIRTWVKNEAAKEVAEEFQADLEQDNGDMKPDLNPQCAQCRVSDNRLRSLKIIQAQIYGQHPGEDLPVGTRLKNCWQSNLFLRSPQIPGV